MLFGNVPFYGLFCLWQLWFNTVKMKFTTRRQWSTDKVNDGSFGWRDRVFQWMYKPCYVSLLHFRGIVFFLLNDKNHTRYRCDAMWCTVVRMIGVRHVKRFHTIQTNVQFHLEFHSAANGANEVLCWANFAFRFSHLVDGEQNGCVFDLHRYPFSRLFRDKSIFFSSKKKKTLAFVTFGIGWKWISVYYKIKFVILTWIK